MDRNENTPDSDTIKSDTNSSLVRFDLEPTSQHLDEFNGSLDEVDEFLELSTLSNPPSTSSFDSTSNVLTNGSSINTKSNNNSRTNEIRSTFQRGKRYVQNLFM
mgnify:FL=1